MASWHAAIWTRRKVVGQDTSAGVTKDAGTMKASADISSAALQASPSRAIFPCPRPGQSSYKWTSSTTYNPSRIFQISGARKEGGEGLISPYLDGGSRRPAAACDTARPVLSSHPLGGERA